MSAYPHDFARRPRAGLASSEETPREADAGSAARVAFRSPADMQANLDAYVAEHDLTLPPGMAWSIDGMLPNGEVTGVLAVNPPGFPVKRIDLTIDLCTPETIRAAHDLTRRRLLRRHLARCRSMALLCTAVMAGAFAADRPVAGVLAASLAFMLLRAAAETRAEL